MNRSLPAFSLGLALSWASPLVGAEASRLARMDGEGVLRWQDNGEELTLFGVNYYAPFWHNYPDLNRKQAH